MIQEDFKELEIKIEDNEVRKYTKTGWNKLINEAAENIAVKTLLKEKQHKNRTKHLKYETFEMRRYLYENKNTKITKVIFNIRAETWDLKVWNQWNFEEICVLCAS